MSQPIQIITNEHQSLEDIINKRLKPSLEEVMNTSHDLYLYNDHKAKHPEQDWAENVYLEQLYTEAMDKLRLCVEDTTRAYIAGTNALQPRMAVELTVTDEIATPATLGIQVYLGKKINGNDMVVPINDKFESLLAKLPHKVSFYQYVNAKSALYIEALRPEGELITPDEELDDDLLMLDPSEIEEIPDEEQIMSKDEQTLGYTDLAYLRKFQSQ